jgi:hypothetical protein
VKRFISLVVDPFIFAIGFVAFAVTRHTPRLAFGSLRRLFVATDGRFNDLAGRISARVHPPVRLGVAHGVLGDLDEGAIDAIARDIERKGYHVFEAGLDDGVCQKIVEFAKRTPATLIPAPTGGPSQSIYDPKAPLAPRYEFEERRIFELPELQELATDATFMAVAQAYLGCRPVNDLVAAWWSPAFGTQASSEAAQLFHFDMDRLKFVKFFVYLTDVDVRQGPHVYVASSHVRKPKAVRRDGRISDEEIIRAYGQEMIVEITGQRGTVLAVDTRGFHKGKAPESGDRLLFQVEYTNSLFGAPYNRMAIDGTWSEQALSRIQRNPAVFQRFERPASA